MVVDIYLNNLNANNYNIDKNKFVLPIYILVQYKYQSFLKTKVAKKMPANMLINY